MEQPNPITVADYLRLEQRSREKHEYRHGKILAMAGGMPRHSLIIANLIREGGNALKGKPCRIYESNLRVRTARSTLYTYPDATIVCGPLQFDSNDIHRTTITNPKVLIEVLSPSTEAYDRVEKFDDYRTMESLEEYVLVGQSRPSVQSLLRQPDGTWSFAWSEGLEAVARIRSVGIDLPLTEVYAGVEFDEVPSPHDPEAPF